MENQLSKTETISIIDAYYISDEITIDYDNEKGEQKQATLKCSKSDIVLSEMESSIKDLEHLIKDINNVNTCVEIRLAAMSDFENNITLQDYINYAKKNKDKWKHQ